MTDIHPSAVIEEGAQIGSDVRIGPFCHVGPHVTLADGVELRSHVVVTGHTSVGEKTVVFSGAVLGEVPQDLKFGGETTYVEIGARNRIREHVTINAGTAGGGGLTRVGDDCLLMAGCHVAHDCQVGNRVIIVNQVVMGGHCNIGDDAIIGGMSALHQFVRIGRGAMIGGMSGVERDVIPYGLVQGERAGLEGLNLVGLKRRGVPREDIHALRAAFRDLGAPEGSFHDRAQKVSDTYDNPQVREIVDFILGASDRSFLTPR
ncbi:MAG: acyl-[acyl-carrier-protein]--UDP-N-acetylglucosamine O-acyltransferase [Rhodobacteraceae bacterium]|nr:acyl-[acyl-carrier-protein]--UDP-N-acetylglucosamine O-acyltransferase [Paracoccaceae bacterium]MAY46721.1 acyl-[acyl-carrier-protein]--UDP-N-acetylglucosamine O-acyltransferase [Paracoccaceae bacterium]QEW20633.1 Acyl-[acyl-carrier-protein]--UDP-N- acetylglucosamine O-acyltransferase [Marinibacterium anthonyi]